MADNTQAPPPAPQSPALAADGEELPAPAPVGVELPILDSPPPPDPWAGPSDQEGPQDPAADPPPIGYPGTWEKEALESGGITVTPKMWPYPPQPGYPGAPGYYPPQQPSYPGAAAYAPPPPQQQQPQQQQQPAYPGYPPIPQPPLAGQPQQGGPQPQPGSNAVPWPMPPAGGPKKKAFICGINYYGTRSQLKGCINDAKCMEYLLTSRLGFPKENILMMTDESPDPMRRPTRFNIWQGFRWLMMDLRPGDSLVFHYSGHGSQCPDYKGEESDGKNETLCPVDFQTAGEIVDDDINDVLVKPLPQGVKLHAIIDACHSGTVMDLPYSATIQGGYARWNSEYASPYVAQRKGTAGGFAVQFGAARDSQVAADTSALSGYVSTGAATYAFIQAVESRGLNITYGELLLQMSSTLRAATGGAQQSSSGVDGMFSMLLGGSANYQGQEPVISANYAFNLDTPVSL